MGVWTTPSFSELAVAARWDAEAFSPYLCELDSKFSSCPRLADLATVTHPSEIIRDYSEEKGSMLFLLAQNIRPLLPDTSTEFRIPASVAERLPLNRLENCDVLVTRSGAHSGMAAVYLGKTGNCYTSGEGLVVRGLGTIDGAYLAAFFNTAAGKAICRRAIYGSGQPHIGPKYLERARIPRLGKTEEKASNLVRSAYAELKKAEGLYPSAESEILERISWRSLLNGKPELSFTSRLSDLRKAGRSDSEFFHPSCSRLATRLRDVGAEKIGTFCERPTRGVQPEIASGGDVVVVDSKSVRADGVQASGGDRTTGRFYDDPKNAKARVRRHDVLLNSTGRGTLGRASCFHLQMRAMCDNHVTILRPDPRFCDPVYLALFLNSPPGIAQSERFQTGSSGQLEIYPEHISQFLIYLPRQKNGSVDLAWQKRLAGKVNAAIAAKTEARRQLDEAVRLVELALEKF